MVSTASLVSLIMLMFRSSVCVRQTCSSMSWLMKNVVKLKNHELNYFQFFIIHKLTSCTPDTMHCIVKHKITMTGKKDGTISISNMV